MAVRKMTAAISGRRHPGWSRERTAAEETNEDHMNVTDPIADMLTRIRNASAARHKELTRSRRPG